MPDYTKYKLKSSDELGPLIEKTDKIYVIACNKCFKKFDSVEEPECGELLKILNDYGKSVAGSSRIDFLCNRPRTAKELNIPEGTENVFVISCGLGVQTIADSISIPVIAAADSINYRGKHGMALTEKTCGACAQCFLNITGGICPVIDCSKSLLNGQCGGAKNGKCEVDPERDCAWEKIEQRLRKQGRTAEFLEQDIQIRDYSRVNYKLIKNYVEAARASRFDGYYGGVHPSEQKERSENLPLVRFKDPDTVVIPLSMHSGAPAAPLVKAGDKVLAGQKIGEAAAFISANVHSSVSGTVIAIEPRKHPTRGAEVLSVVIRNDHKDEKTDNIVSHSDIDSLEEKDIVDIVRECGIVGMGGAGFPTAVKLVPGKSIDTVILNGCECEPMITADHRVLLEYPEKVIFGLRAIMKAVSADKGIIAVEDNKTNAVELLNSKIGTDDDIKVVSVKTKYPQGAEKMLIKRLLGRQVPSGGLPADVGAVVCNVSTSKAITDSIISGVPLTERVVCVTGERIRHPGNFIVKIGTPIRELIDHCGGIIDGDTSIKSGGPMMGVEITDLDAPIIKTTNSIILCEKKRFETSECIKCGRCVDVCPMELKPLYFSKYHDESNWSGMAGLRVSDCIECGCCEYICSSKIPLVEKIRNGKTAVREMKR